jgi:hypothetical protein
MISSARQRVARSRCVGNSGLRHVRFSAAAATSRRGHVLDQVSAKSALRKSSVTTTSSVFFPSSKLAASTRYRCRVARGPRRRALGSFTSVARTIPLTRRPPFCPIDSAEAVIATGLHHAHRFIESAFQRRSSTNATTRFSTPSMVF